jgi:hypothetical protein
MTGLLGYSMALAPQADLELLGFSNPPASASQVAGTIGVCHHTWVLPLTLASKTQWILGVEEEARPSCGMPR